MELGLKDKVALVTGAGSQIGFGKAISLALAKEGCHVVLTDVDLGGTKQSAVEVQALGRKAMALKMDVTSRAEVQSAVKEAIDEFGKIDILVNNAGVCSGIKPFIKTTESDWDKDINVNIKGVLYCTQAVLPGMIERKFGKIINIVTGGGIDGGPNACTYALTKGGVIIFTKSLAVEVAPSGINVNCIAPGYAMTGFARNAPPGMVEKFAKTVPLGRLTDVEDIANSVVFLASNAASDIIGQTIRVSGTV
jgi:NAD(P)-dependent dehydrogenase (short-subunit alcohol dehydrogenase family)